MSFIGKLNCPLFPPLYVSGLFLPVSVTCQSGCLGWAAETLGELFWEVERTTAHTAWNSSWNGTRYHETGDLTLPWAHSVTLWKPPLLSGFHLPCQKKCCDWLHPLFPLCQVASWEGDTSRAVISSGFVLHVCSLHTCIALHFWTGAFFGFF